jgi:hypothetical protein
MIRTAITQAAYDAIGATLRLGSTEANERRSWGLRTRGE